jgi:hypothetical protein
MYISASYKENKFELLQVLEEYFCSSIFSSIGQHFDRLGPLSKDTVGIYLYSILNERCLWAEYSTKRMKPSPSEANIR